MTSALFALLFTFVMPAPDPASFTVTHVAEPRLDLYRPAAKGQSPVVVFVNSTGADYRTWPIYISWAQWLAANGVTAAVYQPGADLTADFDRVMQSVKSPDVILWAASTNVTLGLPLAMDPRRTNIRGAVFYYGAAPVDTIRVDLPVLFVRAGLDSPELNRQIDPLLAQAVASNAPWIIENESAGVHGFDDGRSDAVSRATVTRTLEFIRSAATAGNTYRDLAADAAVGAAVTREDWPAVVTAMRAKAAAGPLDRDSHRIFGIALLETRDFAPALQELETAWEQGRRGFRDVAYPAAQAAGGAGNIERAIHWLDIVYASRFAPPVEELKTSPAFAPVRDTPQFRDFLANHH